MLEVIDNSDKNCFGGKLVIQTQLGKFKKDWKERKESEYRGLL